MSDECGWACAGGVNKPGMALLPVGDLLDHNPERHVSWHTGPTGTDPFSFISHSPISKASPVSMQLQMIKSAACISCIQMFAMVLSVAVGQERSYYCFIPVC